MKRKGFTIIELIVVSIALGIITLGIFTLFNQFWNIKEEVEGKAKLENFQTLVYNNLFDIKKVKALLGSTPYDNINNTYDINETIKYKDDNDNLQNIFVPNKLLPLPVLNNSSVTEALSNFLNIPLINDKLFYSNIYYYYTIQTEKLYGFIPISYQKFTFIHINDSKFSIFLRNQGLGLNPTQMDELFDTRHNYLILKHDDISNSADLNGYVRANWNNIRKKINIIRFSTREQIIEPLKYIKDQLNEAQRKINDWGTIQARFEAHKSISTGNTLNTDYFITCKADLTTNTCDTDTNIISTQTLLKLDDQSANSTENQVKLIDLPTNITDAYKKATTNYGFLIFQGSLNSNTLTINSLINSTNSCSNDIFDSDLNIDFSIKNSAAIGFDNSMNGLECFTSKSMSYMVENFNPFGYPIFFSNAINPTIDETMNESGNTIIGIEGGINRYPNGTINAPYNALIFTFLPNGAIVNKKLYGHIF